MCAEAHLTVASQLLLITRAAMSLIMGLTQQKSVAKDFDNQLISLFKQYAKFVKMAGKSVNHLAEYEAQQLADRLSAERKQLIFNQLTTQMAVFGEVLAHDEKLTDSPKLLWRYLNKLRYTPCPDIFDKIQDTDIVEIYGSDQIHIFQNFNFFDWISIPLEQILSLTWYENTKRDAKIQKLLFKEASRIISGEIKSTFVPNVPWHWIEEINTNGQYRFEIRIKWVSPVYSNRQLAAFISVNECRNLIRTRPV